MPDRTGANLAFGFSPRRKRRWPRNRWLMWATGCVLLYAVSLASWTTGLALSDHSRDGTGFACLDPGRRPR